MRRTYVFLNAVGALKTNVQPHQRIAAGDYGEQVQLVGVTGGLDRLEVSFHHDSALEFDAAWWSSDAPEVETLGTPRPDGECPCHLVFRVRSGPVLIEHHDQRRYPSPEQALAAWEERRLDAPGAEHELAEQAAKAVT